MRPTNISEPSKQYIFAVAGEGGHLQQLENFFALTKTTIQRDEIIIFSDGVASRSENPITVTLPKLNEISKFVSLKGILLYPIILFGLTFKLFFYFRNHKPVGVITFGPFICIPFLLWARIFGIRSVHVETRSRFYTKSKSGFVAYCLANYFVVQNESLRSIYPKSVYGGRL